MSFGTICSWTILTLEFGFNWTFFIWWYCGTVTMRVYTIMLQIKDGIKTFCNIGSHPISADSSKFVASRLYIFNVKFHRFQF